MSTSGKPTAQPTPQSAFEHIRGVRYENVGKLKIKGKEQGPFYRCPICGYLWLISELWPEGACPHCTQMPERLAAHKKAGEP